MGKSGGKKKKEPIGTRATKAATNGMANLIVWAFGAASAFVVFRAAFDLMTTSTHRTSAFGYASGGTVNDAWGLTYSTHSGGFFSKMGLDMLTGMEGAFLAAAQAAMIALALMMGLLPNKNARQFSAIVLLAWVGLWLGNAAWLTYQDFSTVLAATAVLLVFVFACAGKRATNAFGRHAHA